jgi:hypothetical protein
MKWTQATKEIEFHQRLDHPNILKLIGSSVVGRADISHGATSEVRLLLPFYQVTILRNIFARY